MSTTLSSKLIPALSLAALLGVSGAALAAIDKQEAIDRALAEHPGEVTKAYQETKRGQEVWEVKVKGEDGKKYELYYAVETGELVKSEMKD